MQRHHARPTAGQPQDNTPGRITSRGLLPILFSNSGSGCQALYVILAGPTVLSAVGACPPHDGVRRRWRINVASAVALSDARKKSDDLTTATVPAGTTFPAVSREARDLLCVLRGSLLRRPVDLGSVDPHAVQNDCKLPRDGNFGLAQPVSLGELGSPSLQP